MTRTPSPARRPALLAGLAALLLLLLPRASDPVEAADPSVWRSKLTQGDANERFAAIEAARTAKDAQAALPLVEAGLQMREPHLAVACGDALRALGSAPWKDPEIVKVVQGALKAKESDRQRSLARVLCGWGVPEVDATLAQLCAGRRAPEVQADALFLCGLLPRPGKGQFPEVQAAVVGALDKGRTADIRLGACSAAGWLGIAQAVPELSSIVRRDKEDRVGQYAVLALQRIGWTGGIGAFLHVLGQTPRDEARRACLKAVVELAGTADVPDLLALTRHAKKDYRDAAVLALGRLAWERRLRGEPPATTPPEPPAAPAPPPAPPEVVARLLELVANEADWEVRDAARTALLRIGAPAKDLVVAKVPGLIDFQDDDTATTAMELSGLFGAEEGFRSLIKTALYEESPVRRMFAARALEGVKPQDAPKALLDGLQPRAKPKDSELAAVRALGYVRHPAAFEALVGVLEVSGHSDALLREVEFALERLTGRRFGRERPSIWRTWFASAKDPLHSRPKALDRTGNRKRALEKGLFGLTAETERCVEGGLRFLERAQSMGGWWDGNEQGYNGIISCEPAYSGLALLAFLGAGYTHVTGKYRDAIRRATDFLVASQYYDGSFPVTGGGDDGWQFAYVIAMGAWGVNEAYALSRGQEGLPDGDPQLKRAAQAGIDYLVRTQTPGAGWRYSPRASQSDTSATSWVLMTLKTADLAGLDLAQKSIDGVDSWLERCSFDITGETEKPADLVGDHDYEVGTKRHFKAFTGYFTLGGKESSALRQISMTSVGMTCRFFMGWKRTHPYQIGAANFLLDHLPEWMVGTEIPSFHYYWYYGTLAMYQMGGKYWRAWNERIRRMYPEKQRRDPPEFEGSWDADTWRFGAGRLFSTAMSVLTLESYYRFSPILDDSPPLPDAGEGAGKKGGAQPPEEPVKKDGSGK